MRKGTLTQGSPVDYGLIHTNPLKGGGSVEMGENRWVSRQHLVRREHIWVALSAAGLSLGQELNPCL